MKTALLVLLSYIALQAQIFEKIITGSPVTDGGDSRAVTWVDYDNDGDLDLYITNGPRNGENNFFYENLGNGSFQKKSDIALVLDNAPSDGATWGDYNNDGYPDVYIANWWGVKGLLYKNNGNKTFTQILNQAPVNDPSYSETASWGDYNRDGYLDLYVCNSDGSKKNNLYKNNGDGTFTKITTGTVVTDAKSSRNVNWIDFDKNGYPDIFVANENNETENLYKNNGDGSFSTVSISSLLNNAGNSASSSWEDIDNDGDFDVIIANYGEQRNYLLINNGNNVFSKSTALNAESSFSFCTVTGDIDNDGDLDLFFTNAFAESGPLKNYFYINTGNGQFVRDTTEIIARETGWSYGAAFADYDNDGFLDLSVAKCYQANENNALYHNRKNANRWVQVQLKGTVSNSSAIGSVIRISALINNKQVWQQRRLTGQDGYCSQTLRAHFGLGNAALIDTLQILWPSGITQNLYHIPVDSIFTITEDSTLTGNEPESQSGLLPQEIDLKTFPNPFNPATNISFTLNRSESVQISIYNSIGQQITLLYQGEKPAGRHQLQWEAAAYPSGMYICEVRTNTQRVQSKLMLIK